jgi:uncharacterized protein DUF4352
VSTPSQGQPPQGYGPPPQGWQQGPPPQGWQQGPPPQGWQQQPQGPQYGPPPGQQYGPPPPGWTPPGATPFGGEPPRKPRRRWLRWLGIAFLALIVVGSCNSLLGNNDTTTTTGPVEQPVDPTPQAPSVEPTPQAPSVEPSPQTPSEEAPPPAPQANAAGIGDTVSAGDFDFVIPAAPECGVQRIGSAQFGRDADGQYCLLPIQATNTDDTSATTGSGDVTLLGPGGERYSSDSGAVVYLGEDGWFLENLNPGNTATGTVVFDIPEGVTPVAAELRGALLSPAVTVSLQG